MGRIKKVLKIELGSDLCAGSGYSYAGIVDSDTCYDDSGIPYIPARRIKGCMREVLESLLYKKYPDCSDALFGVPGLSDYNGDDNTLTSGNGIRIGNALVENYDELRKALDKIYRSKDGKCINVQDVLGRFTHVVAQTALEDGVAKDNSLRYTRVINNYSPIKKVGTISPMTFLTEISFEEKDEKIVCDIVKGLRHLGLKRNRGFGNVKCTLEECNVRQNDCKTIFKKSEKDGKIRLWYAVKNDEPMVISATDDSGSLNYIPGQKVLGILAGKYLRGGGKADSEEFKNLFLNGKTVFSHLYPFDGEKIYYPAPGYLNCLKKTKKTVYTLEKNLPDEKELSDQLKYTSGNQPKLMNDKFVSVGRNHEVSVCEVKKEIVYHNRHKKDDVERLLYGTEVISAGQMFGGFIETDKEAAKVLAGLLGFETERPNEDGTSLMSRLSGFEEKNLSFGKSRSAQYGLAEFVSVENEPVAFGSETITFEAGEPVLVTFLSDTALLDENGEYTVYCDSVRRALCRELFGADYEEMVEVAEPKKYLSFIKTTLITGFLGTWNLRKYPIPAVKAGSYLVVVPKTRFEAKKNFVGERTLEGYGFVRYDKAEAFSYDAPYLINDSDKETDAYKADLNDCEKKLLRELLAPVASQKWLEKKVIEKLKLESKEMKSVTNSAVGRWKLMLTESCEKGYGDSAFEDFKNRIESVKKEETKEIGKILIKLIEEFRKVSSEEDKNTKTESDEMCDLIDRIGLSREEWARIIKDKWFDYAMALITDRKYTGGERR